MFEKLKKSKNSLVILIILIALLLAYWLFGGGEEPLVSVSTSPEERIIGQELLIELDRLRALNQVGAEIFSDPVFRSLRDTEVKPVPQPIGRSNPFVPSGSGL
jgi:hypothetical protein